ncbi:MAG: B-box zinc finger protein [Armatimonadota bacterium]
MNCTEHPDKVVNSHCDVCHEPACPSCLQDDRGRLVCKRCFDLANRPGELDNHTSDLPVVPDEKSTARKEAIKAFWRSPTGVVILWAGLLLLMVVGIYNTYYDVVYPRHDERFMRVVDVVIDISKLLMYLIVFLILRFPVVDVEPPNVEQPKPVPLPLPKLLLVISPAILLVAYFWWQVFRIDR